MSKTRSIILSTLAAGLAATTVFAASHSGAFGNEVGARKSQMQLYSFNISVLGGMAKGAMPYDADQASAAAANLAVLSKLNAAAMWPMGSDSLSIENTRALPDIWENFPDVQTKGMALAAAADAMAVAAGTDLAALQAAMGPLGGACSACHKAYRQPE